MALKDKVIKMLEKAIEDLKADNTHVSESEAIEIIGILCHREMSKATACEYLNLSRSRFDELIRAGKLPKGKKRVGFKELCWYKNELDDCVGKLKNKNNG